MQRWMSEKMLHRRTYLATQALHRKSGYEEPLAAADQHPATQCALQDGRSAEKTTYLGYAFAGLRS